MSLSLSLSLSLCSPLFSLTRLTMFRLAKVRQENDEFDALSRLRLRVGKNREQTLLSSQVYSFMTHVAAANSSQTSSSNASSSSSSSGAEEMKRAPAIASQQPKGLPVTAPPHSSPSDSRSDGMDGRVANDRDQLISAVSSILNKVHLPLDLDQQSLMRENLQMQKSVQRANTEMQALRDANGQLMSTIERFKAQFICTICQTQEVLFLHAQYTHAQHSTQHSTHTHSTHIHTRTAQTYTAHAQHSTPQKWSRCLFRSFFPILVPPFFHFLVGEKALFT